MKKIAITQRLIETSEYQEIREELDIRWAKLLASINLLPVILPTNYNFKNIFREIGGIDGIILTGGNNLESISGEHLSRIRDNFERKLIACAVKQRIPLFGVCRGMQIIAEFFGAKFVKTKNHIAAQHAIIPSENSQFMRQLKKIKKVNSYHQYAVKKAPNAFLIAATSKDGIIEAIEHKFLPIWAQMWHSEREEPFKKEEQTIFKNFFH